MIKFHIILPVKAAWSIGIQLVKHFIFRLLSNSVLFFSIRGKVAGPFDRGKMRCFGSKGEFSNKYINNLLTL